MENDMRNRIARVIIDQVPLTGNQAWGHSDAIIDALPSMVVPLVWERSEINGWDEDYHTPTTKYVTKYTIRCAYSNGWELFGSGKFSYHKSADEAKAAAQAHHVTQIMAAFGVVA